MAKKNENQVVTEAEILGELRKVADSKDLKELFADRDARLAERKRLEKARDGYRRQAEEKDAEAAKVDAEANEALRSGGDAEGLSMKADQLRQEAAAFRELADRADSQLPGLKPAIMESNRKLYNGLSMKLGEQDLIGKLQADLQREFDSLIQRIEAQRAAWDKAEEVFNAEVEVAPAFNKSIKVKADFRTLNLLG